MKWIVTEKKPSDLDGTRIFWVLRDGAPEHTAVEVWFSGGPNCTKCSGPLEAMLATCPHSLAVKRFVAKETSKASEPESTPIVRTEFGREALPADETPEAREARVASGDVRIGDYVWGFDHNQRLFVPGKRSPVWRFCWVKVEIVGESPRYWTLSTGASIPKKNRPVTMRYAFTEAEIERFALFDGAGQIAEMVRALAYGGGTEESMRKLRAVADIVGWSSEVL